MIKNNFKLYRIASYLIAFCLPLVIKAQSTTQAWTESLKDLSDEYNKKGDFNKSIKMFNDALRADSMTAEDRFYIYQYKSHTYKWLGDYISVERNLKLALQAAAKTNDKSALSATIQSELACMWFDTHQYEKADSVMKIMRRNNFKYQDDYEKSILVMQEAYLLFLKKDYFTAERLYNEALELMQKDGSNCDTPIIYWKTLALYLAQGKAEKAEEELFKGLAIAKECKIDKYVMYLYAEAAIHFAKNGNCEKAFHYSLLRDSTKEAINQNEHLSKIAGLEKEYQTENEREKKLLDKKTLEAQTNFNYLITALLGCAVILCIVAYLWFNYYKSKKYKRLQNKFTAKMFTELELERKRIANDLHDGVSHELLALKQLTLSREHQTNITNIIEEIRLISRNLHPVMFDKVGFKISLEQLAERLQQSTAIIISTEIEYTKPLESHIELQLFRIVQEAVTNAIKHSEAIAIRIGIMQDKQVTVLDILDNGKGFDVNETLNSSKSFGLLSIINRAESIGFKVKIKSSAAGTRITLSN